MDIGQVVHNVILCYVGLIGYNMFIVSNVQYEHSINWTSRLKLLIWIIDVRRLSPLWGSIKGARG